MFRILHTADLHIGMPATGLGEAGQKVREARLKSLEKLLGIANDVDAQAILIAGDVFDDNQVDAAQVEKTAGLLNDKTRLPTYIIPGNHDPYTRDSVYRRGVWDQLRDHVHVLTEAKSVELLEGVALYPCPLSRKHGFEDPTTWIPPRDGEQIRIGLAHGSMSIRPGVGDDDFPIPLNTTEAKGLDYLALGHWHSRLSYPCDASDARTWYSGSHEATKFGKPDSGTVLSVAIEGPGVSPKVDAIDCGTLTWRDWPIDLSTQSLEEVSRELREMPDSKTTLLRLKLTGRTPALENSTVADLVDAARGRFLACQVDDSELMPASIESGLDRLHGSPYLKQTAEELEALAGGEVTSEEDVDPATAKRALEILQEIAWRQSQ